MAASARPTTCSSLPGETLTQILDRVLPIGATINGVTVVNDGTRVPLYTRTPGFVSVNLRAGVNLTDYLDVTAALTNALDRNYRVHGSGVDAPGRSFFASVRICVLTSHTKLTSRCHRLRGLVTSRL